MSIEKRSELTKEETTQLRQLEGVIKKGQRAFCDTAKAVLEIEDGKLYRENHASISAYCAGVWDMSAPEVSRLRKAARVLAALEAGGFDKLPVCESQALALAGLRKEDAKGKFVLDPDKVTKAWQAVIDKGGKVTADLIGEVVQELFGEQQSQQPPSKPKPPVAVATAAVKELTDMADRLDVEKLEKEEKQNLKDQVNELEKLVKILKDSLRPFGSS